MKRILRSFALGLLIGGLTGLWLGMNIGKDQPLLSNPFRDVPLTQQAGGLVEDAVEDAKQGAEQAAETAKDTAEAAQEQAQPE